MKALEGYKTEIGFAAAIAVMLALKFGWIDTQTAEWAYAAIAFWTGVALRQRTKRLKNAADSASHRANNANNFAARLSAEVDELKKVKS